MSSSGSTARGSLERASPSATPSRYGSLSRASAWRSSVANARSRASSAMRPPPISAPRPSSAALLSGAAARVGAFIVVTREALSDGNAEDDDNAAALSSIQVSSTSARRGPEPMMSSRHAVGAQSPLQQLQARDIEARGRLRVAERCQRTRRTDAAHPRLGDRLLHLALRRFGVDRRGRAVDADRRAQDAADRRRCCAPSRMRCIDGEFIIPAAPRIVSVSGFVCRASARCSCATAVARCCSVSPAHLRLRGSPRRWGARRSRALGSRGARPMSRRTSRPAAARSRRRRRRACGPCAGLVVEIVEIRDGGGFLDAVQIRHRGARLQQRRFLYPLGSSKVAAGRSASARSSVSIVVVVSPPPAAAPPIKRRPCARRGRRARPSRPCSSSCSAR